MSHSPAPSPPPHLLAQKQVQLQETQVMLKAATEAGEARLAEVSRLRSELEGSEERFKELDYQRKRERETLKAEQRLVASAFYELGTEFHQAILGGRAVASGVRPGVASPPMRGGASPAVQGGAAGTHAGATGLGAGGQSWINQHRARLSLNMNANPLL